MCCQNPALAALGDKKKTTLLCYCTEETLMTHVSEGKAEEAEVNKQYFCDI